MSARVPDRLARNRVRLTDLTSAALTGPRARPARTVLSAIGVAVGVAALIAISGIAASNRAQFLAELDHMGANLLLVTPGDDSAGDPVPLPETAPAMIERIAPVEAAGVLYTTPSTVHAYRTDRVPPGQTGGITVLAAGPGFPDAIDAGLAWGRWFDQATRTLPTVVLGSWTADTLGITRPGQLIWLGGSWHAVIGVLDPIGLADELDHAVFVGDTWAIQALWAENADAAGAQGATIASIYVRTHPGTAAAVRTVLAPTANPAAPRSVGVSALSDYAEVRDLADASLTTLAAGLGAIALLIGGIGIANTMIVAVIERRGEIGLRRALGARRTHIAGQFLLEAITLSTLGGLVGILAGIAGTLGYAIAGRQAAELPLPAIATAPLLAITIGALAGAWPAWRASGLTPNEALRTA